MTFSNVYAGQMHFYARQNKHTWPRAYCGSSEVKLFFWKQLLFALLNHWSAAAVSWRHQHHTYCCWPVAAAAGQIAHSLSWRQQLLPEEQWSAAAAAAVGSILAALPSADQCAARILPSADQHQCAARILLLLTTPRPMAAHLLLFLLTT